MQALAGPGRCEKWKKRISYEVIFGEIIILDQNAINKNCL